MIESSFCCCCYLLLPSQKFSYVICDNHIIRTLIHYNVIICIGVGSTGAKISAPCIIRRHDIDASILVVFVFRFFNPRRCLLFVVVVLVVALSEVEGGSAQKIGKQKR